MTNPSGWQVPEGGEIKYLTDEELRKFFAAIAKVKNEVIRKRDLAMFHIILAYGLRCAEVPLLRFMDFNGAISPAQLQVTRVKRKRDPKTLEPKPRLKRWYDVTPANTKLINAWLEVRGTYHRAKDNPALFLTFHSTEEHSFSTAHIYDLVRDYGKLAKLERHIHPHMWRHTTAVKMAQAGHSAYDIMYQLGHTNILSGQTYVNRFGAERAALSVKIGKALEFER